MFEEVRVQSCMTSPAITSFATVSIGLAQSLMDEYNIRHLPVVDDSNGLIGILSSGDIRRASPSDATSLSVWEIRYLWDKLTVENVMTRRVVTISPDAPIVNAVRLMLDNRFNSLPVVEATGRLVGILTEVDLYRLIVELSEKAPA
jgi:acetoin utilization protein AcuB